MARTRSYNPKTSRSVRARSRHARASRRPRRPWLRLPDDAIITILFALLFLAGLTALLWSPRASGLAGAAVCAVGLAGLARMVWAWSLRVRNRKRLRERERIRAERREARRRRDAREHEEVRRRDARDETAHRRARDLQREQRVVELGRAREAEERRRERDGALTAEAERLAALDDRAFLDAVATAFEGRGFTVARVGEEAACDLLLAGADGVPRAIASVVPQARRAGTADVRALESCRARLGAESAWLVGASGFSPAALRAASDLPVTLADPHLLAQWTAGTAPAKPPRS